MMRTRILLAALGLLCVSLLPAAAAAEDGAKAPSGKAIGAAIERAAAWLTKRFEKGFENDRAHDTPEIVLLTLVHAGVSHKGPVFRAALKATLDAELAYTYRVSSMAMALSRINPYLYRARIAHCAQWLVDAQRAEGEWGYPGGAPGSATAGAKLRVKPPVTDEQAQGGPKAAPIVIIPSVSKTDAGPTGKGDFSNTQFALLGLRACAEARIIIPKATWKKALAYQVAYQQRDGSWGYVLGGEQDQSGYASLTCAGIAGVAICHHGLGKRSPASHPAVKKGLAWLAKRWDAAQNVDVEESTFIGPSGWQYYHLYAMERAGRILGLKQVGKHDWYAEGARWILARQEADGSWSDPGGGRAATSPYLRTADTCFAILFLSLATPPLTGR